MTSPDLVTSQGRRRFQASPARWTGIAILAVMIAAVVFAPLIAVHEPLTQNIADRLQGPSLNHLFGTDNLGRDIFSRVLYGGRVSILVAAGAVVASLVIGVPAGLIAGYRGGIVDDLVSRVIDILSALPGILVAISVIVVVGPSTWAVAIVLGVVSAPQVARLVRGVVLRERDLPYVKAALSAGAGSGYIMVRTILPSTYADIFVLATLTAAHAILAEAGLAFLGLGVPPPDPTWGSMISASIRELREAWWFGVFPGIALALVVLGLQLIAWRKSDV